MSVAKMPPCPTHVPAMLTTQEVRVSWGQTCVQDSCIAALFLRICVVATKKHQKTLRHACVRTCFAWIVCGYGPSTQHLVSLLPLRCRYCYLKRVTCCCFTPPFACWKFRFRFCLEVANHFCLSVHRLISCFMYFAHRVFIVVLMILPTVLVWVSHHEFVSNTQCWMRGLPASVHFES